MVAGLFSETTVTDKLNIKYNLHRIYGISTQKTTMIIVIIKETKHRFYATLYRSDGHLDAEDDVVYVTSLQEKDITWFTDVQFNIHCR